VNWQEDHESGSLLVGIASATAFAELPELAVLQQRTALVQHAAACEKQLPLCGGRWLPVGENPVPTEFEKAQRHPAGASWLGLLPPHERMKSAREFALKLRDALVRMRSSASAVFLGPAPGRGVATRSRLRDELEKSGYRVVPDADYVYEDAAEVRAHLTAALVAIHFPGDGLGLEGLTAMEESFLSARKTLLITPFGSTPSDDEAGVVKEIEAQLGSGGRFAGVAHTRLEGKTDDQVWDTVKREVRAARFKKEKNEFEVGVACEVRDLAGAKALAGMISQMGVRAQCPSFDTAASITEKLQALRNTITQSQALVCYWTIADGVRAWRSVSNRMPAASIRRRPGIWGRP
jgi:hypothetical protein